MQFDEIIKDTNYSDSKKPNLLDYKTQYEHFDWNIDAFTKLGNKKLTNLSTPARNLILGLVLTVKVNYSHTFTV